MNTLEHDGKQYEITGYAEDGLPIIRGIATTTVDGTDEHGNPKQSVNVFVPSAPLVATPGEVS